MPLAVACQRPRAGQRLGAPAPATINAGDRADCASNELWCKCAPAAHAGLFTARRVGSGGGCTTAAMPPLVYALGTAAPHILLAFKLFWCDLKHS